MPTVYQIQRAQNESKRLDKILKVVIPTLSELYGAPNWMLKPKEDQDPEKILKQWADALGGYSEHQLKMACLKYYKYNKSTGFPVLGKIESELYGEKEEDYVSRTPLVKGGVNIESQIMEADKTRNMSHPYLTIHYREAIKHIIRELLPQVIGVDEIKRIESFRKSPEGILGYKYKVAREKGLFDNFDDILESVYLKRNGKNTSNYDKNISKTPVEDLAEIWGNKDAFGF